MSLNPYIKGRIERHEFFLAALVTAVATAILLGGLVALFFAGEALAAVAVLLAVIVYFYSMFLRLSLAVRRCHDLGHSGWLSLLFFLPPFSFFLFLYLIFAAGSKDENEYGKRSATKLKLREIIFPKN
jgi:uncharacterized membrane protein YhaH (DUF805 family)